MRSWFAPLQSRGRSRANKRYCVEKDALTLPTFALQVIDRRPAGERRSTTSRWTTCMPSSPARSRFTTASAIADRCRSRWPRRSRRGSGRRGGAERQPQLRGAHPPAGARELTWPRRRWSSPTRWPARWTSTSTTEPLGDDTRRASPSTCATSGRRRRRCRRRWRVSSSPRSSSASTRRSSTATSTGARCHVPAAGSGLYAWDPDSTYVRKPPFFEGMTRDAGAAARHHRRARARLGRRLGHDGPHLARRLDPDDQPRRAISD